MSKKFPIVFDREKKCLLFSHEIQQGIIDEIKEYSNYLITARCNTPEARVAAGLERRADGTRIGQYIVQKVGLENLHKISNEDLIDCLEKR